MASESMGRAIVIMGVSGVGKSTIGEMLAKVFNWEFVDADDFHPQSNKKKMQQGIPLSEEDRIPWLETLQAVIRERLNSGRTLVLGCSALKKQYREILRHGDCDYVDGGNCSNVNFILLDAPAEAIAGRLEKRAAEGKHIMPPTLLQTQLDLLEVDDDSERILKVDATLSPQEILECIQVQLRNL